MAYSIHFTNPIWHFHQHFIYFQFQSNNPFHVFMFRLHRSTDFKIENATKLSVLSVIFDSLVINAWICVLRVNKNPPKWSKIWKSLWSKRSVSWANWLLFFFQRGCISSFLTVIELKVFPAKIFLFFNFSFHFVVESFKRSMQFLCSHEIFFKLKKVLFESYMVLVSAIEKKRN